MTTLQVHPDPRTPSFTGEVVPALDGLTPDALASAFDACKQITRARARNFYYGLKLLPEPRRSGVFAIYAWMRQADDLADEGGSIDQRRAALDHFAQETALMLEGNRDVLTRGPTWPALAATVRSYRLDPALLTDTLAGLREDLDHRGYATDAELDEYLYRVASTVGLLCVGVWGLRRNLSDADRAGVRELAIARGRAFQLTNILRDFAEDFDDKPSRVYLSRESFDRMGLSAQELRAWSKPDRCERYVQGQIQRARDWYLESARLDELIAPDCRPTLWAMTEIYRSILEKIAKDPSRIVRQRVRLSGLQKSLIALRATASSRWSAARA